LTFIELLQMINLKRIFLYYTEQQICASPLPDILQLTGIKKQKTPLLLSEYKEQAVINQL